MLGPQRGVMRNRKSSRLLPPIVVVVKRGESSPAQAAALRALFDRLLAPCPAPGNEAAPAPGGDNRGGGEHDGPSKPG